MVSLMREGYDFLCLGDNRSFLLVLRRMWATLFLRNQIQKREIRSDRMNRLLPFVDEIALHLVPAIIF